jgi:hypothetical protein
MFLDHTQRRSTVGRTPLDECSAPRRDLYLTTHDTHIRQTSMPPGGIRTCNLSTQAAADLRLSGAVTGTGSVIFEGKGKGKAIPLQAWTGPEVSRKLRLPDFMTIGT